MKYMSDLIARLNAANLLKEVVGETDGIILSELTYDSRSVPEGSLFLCKGAGFEERYLHDALAAGANAWMAENKPKEATKPGILVKDMRQAMAFTADWFFDSPWKSLVMIGVTGTKGKSTTVAFLKQIFDTQSRALGQPPAGLTSSQTIFDGVQEKRALLTTPETVDLYRYLYNAVKAGISTMIVEVSSQALKYERVGGITFDHAVFLNISPDHISDIEHPDFEDYFASKLRLFDVTGHAYISADSDGQEALEKAVAPCAVVTRFSLKGEGERTARNILWDKAGSFFDICGADGCFPVFLPMHGAFNVENALAAASVALESGVDPAYVAAGLAHAKLEGRMVFMYSEEEKPLTVLIDYAHNGISFDSVFEAVATEFPQAEKIAVFGAPGDKAVNRRAGLGRAASQWADRVYLTADDPAHEAVEDINAQIVSFFEKPVSWRSVPDRIQAIEDAILSAPPGAIVLLLGKGSERAQKTAKGPQPYAGDEAVARIMLETRKKEGPRESTYFPFSETTDTQEDTTQAGGVNE